METEGDSKSNKEDGKETKMMEQQRKIVKTQEETSTNWRTNKYKLEKKQVHMMCWTTSSRLQSISRKEDMR